MSTFAGSAELEIALRKEREGEYGVDLTFAVPHYDRKNRLGDSTSLAIHLDVDRLKALSNDEEAYRRLLSESLLGESSVRNEWTRARTTAETLTYRLRVRIYVSADAPELHAVRWELLGDPDLQFSPLFRGERCSLSRFIASKNNRPVLEAMGRRLRALVLIASPNKLENGLDVPKLDVQAESELARSRLRELSITELVGPDEACSARLKDELRNGYDILYLICHGGLVQDRPLLYLELPNGNAEIVSGNDLAEWMLDLPMVPRLVVLASCRSAGAGAASSGVDEGFLSAIGPRLAQAGIPAVIGMQGSVTETTALNFFKSFFQSVLADGEIESAVSVARGDLGDRPDWWMPVLFCSLIEGRLWSPKAYHVEFTEWDLLLTQIERKNCLPVLGSGLVEDFLGSNRVIAQTWAKNFDMPVPSGMRDQLPQVAQFLKSKGRDRPLTELEYYYNERIRAAGGETPEKGLVSAEISRLGKEYRNRHSPDIHDVLAQLPCRIYLCTKPDNLMADALTNLNPPKNPTVKICPWNQQNESPLYEMDPSYRPDEKTPLVYHLFGHLEDFDSIALTEDNYFDLMLWLARSKKLTPSWLKTSLIDSTLLFLGFHLEDWDFRVLLRSISNLGGATRVKDLPHIAVQLSSQTSEQQAQERVRRYFEEYFGKTEIPLSIFWGSVQEFAEELHARLQDRRKPISSAVGSPH